ncbi:MAG: NADPH-dependent FMN reductase [Acidimicrobiia bacterium]
MLGEPKAIVSVLAIPGSLRRNSYNRSLLNAARSLAPPDMTITVYGRLDEVPVFNQDLEVPTGDPDGVTDLRAAVAGADGVLISTPEYNQSVPGVVKNMIDWLSRTDQGLAGKPVAVTGVTTGPWGTRLAQTTLRQMLTSTQALLLPNPTIYLRTASDLFDRNGTLNDDSTQQQVRDLLTAFGVWIRQFQPMAGN